ncbi:AMP-binding protein [Burkholderia ubonensis]|uniref:AMP-binding protein n=1 Tax=Burkholderia ubonensis TaxID=101571 RepID=UPI000757753F|nr:AMP-binding protein [Burkholderia ubonensis]KVO87843.1 AMP-dependent synthetase [Burkholderia ubonensis]KWE84961.1 AMP-dependent synthetase [Burkholderia ubonensis]
MIALHDLLSADADADARTVVCRDGDARITLAELRARADAIARVVKSSGARRVAISTDDPYEFACALFAVAATGREAVIPASAAPGYLRDLAHAYDMLLDDDALAACAPGRAEHGAPVPSRAIDADAAITLYTSGSSGQAKALRKSLAQFDAEVRTLQREWAERVGTAVTLSSVPHHHIYGLLFRIMWPLASGRAFDRALSLDPQQLQRRLAAYGDGIVVSTPSHLMRWPALPGFPMPGIAPRVFFSSGGPLPADAASVYAAAFGAAPLEIFGSTETGGIAWRRQDRTQAWQPMPGIDVRCDDDGALCVRSAHLGHDRWHRTDDAARFDAHGRFELTGRRDRVVKLDGKRVSLPELEARIVRHDFVEQAAATVVEGASRARVGVVAVLSEAGRHALRADGRVAVAAALRHALGAYFDAAALPRHWRFRRAMPFDARGKLPAAAIAAAFAPTPEGFELLAERHDDDGWHYELRVPATLAHFDGHFPGMPILPGVVQIDWAVRLARREVAALRTVRSIDHLKFKAPVPPDAVLALRIAHDQARGCVKFAFRRGERECTSGAIVYGASA